MTAMNMNQQFEKVAQRYRSQGYQVTVHPGPEDLPDFAKDFKVEMVARRGDEGVLVSAKESSRDFDRDPALAGYAEAVEKQPNWQYDVFVLGPPPALQFPRDAEDSSEPEIRNRLATAERLTSEGMPAEAVLVAWGALEAAMRYRLRTMGGKAEWGSPPRQLLNDVLTTGLISHSEFRDLEGLMRLRNIIAHGFSVPEFGRGSVSFLTETAEKLLPHADASPRAGAAPAIP